MVIGLWGLYRLNRIDRSHQEALSQFPLARRPATRRTTRSTARGSSSPA
ncbi:hypothetical protein [Variovorax atrisoli]